MAGAFEVFPDDLKQFQPYQVLFFDWTLVEFVVVLLLLRLWSAATTFFARIGAYLVGVLLVSVYLLQIASLMLGGEFLSRLAVENFYHVDLVGGPWTIFILPIVLIVLVLLFFAINKWTDPSPIRKLSSVRIVHAMVVVAIVWSGSQLLSQASTDERDKRSARFGKSHPSPLTSFGALWWNAQQESNSSLSQDDINILQQFGITLHPLEKYPLVKSSVYQSRSPLVGLKVTEPMSPNVILIFVEGMSARSLEVYGARYAGLTPNLVKFANRSIVVDNYWSHTAASYRGMKGQLCSLYPLHDDAKIPEAEAASYSASYYCLPHLFLESGYYSQFINAHETSTSYLDEMMPALGFDLTLSAELLSRRYLRNEKAARSGALSDHQFFRALSGVLQENNLIRPGKKFFLSSYNLGTHAFFDVAPGEIKWGDGSNNSLNTIHNFDHAFGEFWESFMRSPYADNTVVILTSDHCHYTESSFVSAFDDRDYPKLFIDKIPLMVYLPGNGSRIAYDARNATSVDLAPTLAHILQLPNGVNPWIGTSIFERDSRVIADRGIAGYLNNNYIVGGGLPQHANDPNNSVPELRATRRFFDYISNVEISNRIWNQELRKAKISPGG